MFEAVLNAVPPEEVFESEQLAPERLFTVHARVATVP